MVYSTLITYFLMVSLWSISISFRTGISSGTISHHVVSTVRGDLVTTCYSVNTNNDQYSLNASILFSAVFKFHFCREALYKV